MKLRLSEWASIAEVVGAIGVVVSLIYVGIQIRANTEEIRATNRHQLIGRAHTATTSVSSNPELAQAMAKLQAGEDLSPTEIVQYGYFMRSLIYDVQEAFLLRQEERLDEEYWDTRSSLFSIFMNQEVPRQIYERDRQLGVLHEDFVAWADTTLDP